MNAGEARRALLEALQSAVKADGTQMRVMGARTGLNPSDLSKAKLGKLQSITLDKLIVMCAAFGIGVKFEIGAIEQEQQSNIVDIQYQTDDPEFDFYK